MTRKTDPILAERLVDVGTWRAELQKLTSAAAEPIVRELTNQPSFCLWLVGNLGAGKTTVTGAILRCLGLGPQLPVTSPTFTYLNEYQINGHWYAHIDLYRAGSGFSLEELGFVDSRQFSGYFIEWPDAIVDTSVVLPPTHILEISAGKTPDERTFRLQRCSDGG